MDDGPLESECRMQNAECRNEMEQTVGEMNRT